MNIFLCLVLRPFQHISDHTRTVSACFTEISHHRHIRVISSIVTLFWQIEVNQIPYVELPVICRALYNGALTEIFGLTWLRIEHRTSQKLS